MAWPEKRAKGWVLRWDLPGGGRGTSKPYPSRAACLAAMRDFNAANPPRRGKRKGGPRPAEPLTIAQLGGAWRLAKLADAERMRRPGAATYLDMAVAGAVSAATELGWLRPSDASIDAVEVWKRQRGHIGTTSRARYLRAILRWGRDRHGTACDPRVYAALRPPQSRSANVELMLDAHVGEVLERAEPLGVWTLMSCLLTYGWRPITACRIRVGWLRGDEIQIDVKHGGEPHVHPLFPFHVAPLRTLSDKRKPDDFLFRDPRTDKPWSVDKRGSAMALAQFFRDHIRPDGAIGVGNVYALKRVAITRMAIGAPPWRAPLGLAEVRLFTGHKADAMVLRYLRTNVVRARSLMGTAPDSPGAAGTGDEKPPQAK